MKKLLVIGVLIIGVFTAIVILTNQSLKVKEEGSEYDKENLHLSTVELIGNKNYENIATPKEVEKAIKSGESTIVYFFSPLCGYCKEMTPVLMPIAEEKGIEILQYNVLEYEQGYDEYKVTGTPALVHFKDGKETERLAGLREADIITEFLDVVTK